MIENDTPTSDYSELPMYYSDKGKIRFMYKGRHYSLFKPRLGSSYYVKVQKQGFRKSTSLHTDDPERAVAMALNVIDYMLTGVDPEALKEPSHASADLVTRTYRILAARHGLKMLGRRPSL